MEIINRKPTNEVHSYIPELKDLYRQGRCTRREFLRTATLLGMSLASASAFLAACATPEPTEAPTEAAATQPPTKAPTEAPTEAPTATPVPAGPKRGGTLTICNRMLGVDHPARYSWVAESNVTRFVIQYLTRTDQNNITHPYLLEKWEASEDLKTWTLHLRKNVTWTTGEPFNADDVVFTMKEWLNPDVGSSILGMMSYLQPTNIEKKDDHTVVLHLDSPQIAVPEHLYHYPGPMLDHRTFEGDWLKNPVGTGPFTLEEWSVGERGVLKARKEGYWEMGEDGKPLPYLDEIIHIDLGEEETARVSALKGGQIDAYHPVAVGYQALKDDPNVAITPIATTQTQVLRMRVDMEPWTDARVRNAVKLCQDKEKMLKLAFFGEGITGPDCHVSPVHPEFCPMEANPYDPEKARALLAEAGYPDGLDVTLTVGSGWPEQVSVAETLKQDAEAAGLRITLNTIPSSAYWDVWTECDLGITSWTHRPLAVMVLPLAYVCDKEGNPVPWNESRWCDEEFDELLTKAMGTLDVEERRAIMCDIQRIQVERGSIAIPFWNNAWVAFNPKFKAVTPHPTDYMDEWRKVWYDPEA
jgi:peptide/nickel transport system substrate-binding protein